MARKKKRKYTRRANPTTRASTRKKKRQYTKRAGKATRRKYTKRAPDLSSFQLPEILRNGLEQVQAQITARTEELVLSAVSTDAPSVSAMLHEAAKSAENDPMTSNLLLIRSNLQNALDLISNLANRPKAGRKAKKEVVADEVEEETADEKKKVVDIKKKGKAKKAASTLKKKSAEG